MLDLQKVNSTKEKILSIIQSSGPSYPAKVARDVGLSPLFIGAFLSELVAEKKLEMSSMRVGSSPLYYLGGQEPQLEQFTNYLNHKEREAFTMLKQSAVLEDTELDPAIRVALRKIKDFAVPLTVRVDTEEKLFWKFFTFPDESAQKKLNEILKIPEPKKPEPKQEVKTEEIKEAPKKEKVEKITEEEITEVEKPKKKEIKPNKFTELVKDYLLGKDIEVINDIASKPKEYHARVRIDTLLGKQELFLIAKEKKKITEDDLAIALHKAQVEKMPALLLAKGELDKPAKAYLDQWKNVIKFEKLKI